MQPYLWSLRQVHQRVGEPPLNITVLARHMGRGLSIPYVKTEQMNAQNLARPLGLGHSGAYCAVGESCHGR